MSTYYKVFEIVRDSGETHIIELFEHSGKLDIVYFGKRKGSEYEEIIASFRDFTPEQIITIALEMLKVASYQIDIDDLKKAINNVAAKDKSGVGYVLDNLRL